MRRQLEVGQGLSSQDAWNPLSHPSPERRSPELAMSLPLPASPSSPWCDHASPGQGRKGRPAYWPSSLSPATVGGCRIPANRETGNENGRADRAQHVMKAYSHAGLPVRDSQFSTPKRGNVGRNNFLGTSVRVVRRAPPALVAALVGDGIGNSFRPALPQGSAVWGCCSSGPEPHVAPGSCQSGGLSPRCNTRSEQTPTAAVKSPFAHHQMSRGIRSAVHHLASS
jgi:hypothetical protein